MDAPTDEQRALRYVSSLAALASLSGRACSRSAATIEALKALAMDEENVDQMSVNQTALQLLKLAVEDTAPPDSNTNDQRQSGRAVVHSLCRTQPRQHGRLVV